MEKKLDLELLYTLTIVAETKSLKKTSERIYKSHSAVSMQIKRLEGIVGTKLIGRKNQKIEITEKGEQLLGFAKEMLRINNLALGMMDDEKINGKLSIGIPIDYTKNFIKDVLPELKSRIPNIQLKITCDSSRNLRKMIETGNLDVAIVAAETGISDDEFLWSEKLSWVSSDSFNYDKKDKLPVAMFEYDCIIKNMMLNSLKNTKVPYEQVIGTPILDDIAEAVQEGVAVSLLPESVFKKFKYKILSEDIIKTDGELFVNLISSGKVEDKVIKVLVENIIKVFSVK